MLPYYVKMDKRLISDSLSDNLVKFALENVDKFTDHVTDQDSKDGNSYYTSNELHKIPEIKQLLDSCSIKFYVILYMHKPNVKVVKHKDNPKYRKANLIHPLHPTTEYASTVFWEDSINPVCECDSTDRLPVFLNLDKYHGLQNNNNIRLNLQFSFQESFETVVELYQQGKLFK